VNSLERQRGRWLPAGIRRIALVSLLLPAAAGVVPAAASAALTATQIRIGNHPAFVRVVVDFRGGTLHANDVESPDPMPFDGRARVRVTDPGVTTTASPVTSEGVAARVLQRSGFVVVTLHARRHRFKYLEHTVLHSPERLVIDRWKARPPGPAAEFRSLRKAAASASTASLALLAASLRTGPRTTSSSTCSRRTCATGRAGSSGRDP
jgi:hypothetical protein